MKNVVPGLNLRPSRKSVFQNNVAFDLRTVKNLSASSPARRKLFSRFQLNQSVNALGNNGQYFAGVVAACAYGEVLPIAISSNSAYKQLLAVPVLRFNHFANLS